MPTAYAPKVTTKRFLPLENPELPESRKSKNFLGCERMKGKYVCCLLCAENGLIVGFPDRSKKPWNRINVSSRIDHLEEHGLKGTRKQLLKIYPRYFVRTIDEVEKYVEQWINCDPSAYPNRIFSRQKV